jgi:hypothetical protein
MACGLVAAPTWTGIWTKWNQQVRALGAGVGAATAPANSRQIRTRPSASIRSRDSRPKRATARAVQRDSSMTWAHPSADAASGENQASREPDAQREAAGRHSLEQTQYGGTGRHCAIVGRGQGRGYRRALPRSARQACHGRPLQLGDVFTRCSAALKIPLRPRPPLKSPAYQHAGRPCPLRHSIRAYFRRKQSPAILESHAN